MQSLDEGTVELFELSSAAAYTVFGGAPLPVTLILLVAMAIKCLVNRSSINQEQRQQKTVPLPDAVSQALGAH